MKDICNELDIRSLCHKILQNVSILLNADRGSLFLVQGKSAGSGTDGPKKYVCTQNYDGQQILFTIFHKTILSSIFSQ